MKPLHALLTKLASIIVGFILGKLIGKGLLSAENADALNPLILEVVNFYLPAGCASLAGAMHEIYEKLIYQRLFNAAIYLPAGSNERLISEEALGDGKQRTAAKTILGVK